MDKDVIAIDLKDILSEIKTQVARLNWQKEDIQKYLVINYHKLTVLSLSDSEILEFVEYLAGLPNGTLPPLKQPARLPFKGLTPLKISPLSMTRTKQKSKDDDNNNYFKF
ncbi:MAG: hypothetical protein ACRC80_09015 [Waterburya sp.]